MFLCIYAGYTRHLSDLAEMVLLVVLLLHARICALTQAIQSIGVILLTLV